MKGGGAQRGDELNLGNNSGETPSPSPYPPLPRDNWRDDVIRGFLALMTEEGEEGEGVERRGVEEEEEAERVEWKRRKEGRKEKREKRKGKKWK